MHTSNLALYKVIYVVTTNKRIFPYSRALHPYVMSIFVVVELFNLPTKLCFQLWCFKEAGPHPTKFGRCDLHSDRKVLSMAPRSLGEDQLGGRPCTIMGLCIVTSPPSATPRKVSPTTTTHPLLLPSRGGQRRPPHGASPAATTSVLQTIGASHHPPLHPYPWPQCCK